jgi:hypothetical protein
MAGFVYNPAESIKQDFQQAGSGIGNIFAQVIQQQQRDYTLAENTFANIEALKKDLNIYGQKSVSSKANALLGHASSAILANGKLDYSKLGEIRQAVSDIKDLKTGYDLGAKEYERMLQMGLANKENLTSFEGFYKDLSAKMSDENLIKNPRDLQAALADTYTKSLDATKMFGKAYLAANPYQKVAYDVKDPKTGAMMRVQGELPTGWTIDAAGNKIPPKSVTVTNPDGTTSVVDAADQTLAQIKASNPDVLAAMRRQAGFAGENMSDKQLVQYYTSKVPMTAQVQQLKSADELKTQAAQAKTAETTSLYAEKKIKSELASEAAGRALTQAQIDKINADLQANAPTTNIYEDETKKAINFGGKGYVVDIPQVNGRTIQGAVTEIYKDKKTGKNMVGYMTPPANTSIDTWIANGMIGGVRSEKQISGDLGKSNLIYNLKRTFGAKKGTKPFVSDIEGFVSSSNPIKAATAESAPKMITIGGKNYDFITVIKNSGLEGLSLEEQKKAITEDHKDAQFK